jgi:hypothetical protein
MWKEGKKVNSDKTDTWVGTVAQEREREIGITKRLQKCKSS